MSKRLPNEELAFYENMLALMRDAGQASKRLIYHTMDDAEALQQVNGILVPLAKMKEMVLQRREQRKNNHEL